MLRDASFRTGLKHLFSHTLRIRIEIMQAAEVRKTGKLQLALAWSIAGIPLLAGVYQTLVNAMKLFQ